MDSGWSAGDAWTLRCGCGARASLDVAQDANEKRDDAQNCHGEPEAKHDVLRAHIPRAKAELRAERNLGVAKEGGEFGQVEIVARVYETLEELGIGPVAYKEHGAREQGSNS